MSPRMRRAGRQTFSSLKIRNYRLYFVGQLVSVSGTWIQWVAQTSLIVYTLHKGGVVLGIATGLQFLPMFVGGMWGGIVADRYDKRTTLIWTQALQAALAAAFGVLVLTHVIQVWQIYLLAFLFGVVTVVDMPARQAFVSEMVGSSEVPNAVALNSAMFNSGRLAGPALAVLLIKLFNGTGAAFMFNAASFAAVIIALWLMRPEELQRAPIAPRAKGQVREGIAFMRKSPVLKDTLFIITIVATFGFNFTIVLPLMAKTNFHGGVGIYGLLSSIMAIGAIAGGLVAARRKPSMKFLIAMGLAFGAFLLTAAYMPSTALEAIMLIPVGATSMLFLATANSTLQLSSPAIMRGRVMALYSLLFVGGTAVGGPAAGWISQTFGPRTGLAFGAVLSLAASGYLWIRARNERVGNRGGAKVVPITETSAMGDIAGDTPAPAAR
ncbi:MAG TPA: MFS transporter [Actinomycetota bacterium]|nr:MFS transporter [Actinomycetota bacterium]